MFGNLQLSLCSKTENFDHLFYSLSFNNKLISHFHSRIQQAFQQVSRADAHQVSCLICTLTHKPHAGNYLRSLPAQTRHVFHSYTKRFKKKGEDLFTSMPDSYKDQLQWTICNWWLSQLNHKFIIHPLRLCIVRFGRGLQLIPAHDLSPTISIALVLSVP